MLEGTTSGLKFFQCAVAYGGNVELCSTLLVEKLGELYQSLGLAQQHSCSS